MEVQLGLSLLIHCTLLYFPIGFVFHLSCPYIFNLLITIHALGIYVYWIGSKFKYKKLKLCSNVKNMGSSQSYVWCICSMNHNIESTLVFIYTHIIHSFNCWNKKQNEISNVKKKLIEDSFMIWSINQLQIF